MKTEFVTYEQALALKELGFDEHCFGRYWIKEFQLRSPKDYNASTEKIDSVSAPLYQQAFRWFDYSTDWSGFIIPSKEEGCFDWWIQNYEDPNYLTIESDDWYRNREEAELACLNKLIEIIKTRLI